MEAELFENLLIGSGEVRRYCAVGRTAFWEPLVNLRAKLIPREEAVAEIPHRYQEFVSIFEAARHP